MIISMCFSAMHLGVNTLFTQLESSALVWFVLLPFLPAIPIATWLVLEKRSRSLFGHTQLFLRTGAGQDELIVRELEQQSITRSQSNNSG